MLVHGNMTGCETLHEPFYLMLNDCRIADIEVTGHARLRFEERKGPDEPGGGDAESWMWQCLKQRRIRSHSRSERDTYVVDNDMVLAARLTELHHESDSQGNPLYKMVVVTFLGRVSVTPELRDLKGYYARQRNLKRQTAAKRRRRRKK